MSEGAPACTVTPEALLAYLADEGGEPGEVHAFEEHLFSCPRCANRLATLERLRTLVATAARHAELSLTANAGFLERAERDGLTRREYAIPANGRVDCVAGPEDLVVVRLAARFTGIGALAITGELHDLDRHVVVPLPAREVVADRDRDEVILVFPGALVRGYPRSRWTLRVQGEGPEGQVAVGSFVMDHTP